MSAIVIAGDTSGTCTLQAAAVAGSTTLTLPTTSGVLYSTPAGGVINVANGGTGASTLTGYVKGTGTAALTGSATVPGSDVSGNITGSAANVTGTVAVANGGTGLTATPTNGQLDIGNGTGFTRAALTAGSNITITNGVGSISIAATVPASVTSVATGNGLSGGTITSTGTLVVACPGFNTVGSYCYAAIQTENGQTVSAGGNYAAGLGNLQIYSSANINGEFFTGGFTAVSGTWKWMGATVTCIIGGGVSASAIACRVS